MLPLVAGWAAAATAGLPLPASVHFDWDTVQPFFHADSALL